MALLLATSYSCSKEDMFTPGEGKVTFNTTVNDNVKTVSRALTAEEIQSLSDRMSIWISSDKGLIRKYVGRDNVPSELWLVEGNYVAEAWTGDSVPASFESKYYKGYKPFTINPASTSVVNLECKIANVVVSVRYDEAISNLLDDYKIVVGHENGTLDFVGTDERKGYFMMPNDITSLTWTLTGTLLDGSKMLKTGTIDNVKSAIEYILTVKYQEDISEAGGGYFDVVVDESTDDVVDDIIITAAPSIVGVNYNIADPLYKEQGKVGRVSIYVSAASELTAVEVSCPEFQNLGVTSATDGFEYFGMSSDYLTRLNELGFSFRYDIDNETGVSNFKLSLEEIFTNLLSEGEYHIEIKVVDENEKFRTAALNLIISNASVVANEADEVSVWATHATITGTILKEGVTGHGFNYRVVGSNNWTAVTADETYTAQLTGLTPGTTYEYYAVCDNFSSTVIKTFTTESALQLANSGFENWQTTSSPYLLYGGGDEMFWDSGNHGSATMSKNITTPDGTYKRSGNYSAKLESQFVGIGGLIGKFAAGNVFVGKYLDTDGTDGVLGWGRPFKSRPSALRGYVKYNPGQVAYTSLDEVTTDDMDMGAIYLALLDGTMSSYVTKNNITETWPIIIKTKESSRQLFNKDAAQVIGYGELILNEATSGDGLVEFMIPIEYFRTDIKAQNIVVVCSSSRYGDYFTGGNSIMYIDDLELIYE